MNTKLVVAGVCVGMIFLAFVFYLTIRGIKVEGELQACRESKSVCTLEKFLSSATVLEMQIQPSTEPCDFYVITPGEDSSAPVVMHVLCMTTAATSTSSPQDSPQ